MLDDVDKSVLKRMIFMHSSSDIKYQNLQYCDEIKAGRKKGKDQDFLEKIQKSEHHLKKRIFKPKIISQVYNKRQKLVH